MPPKRSSSHGGAANISDRDMPDDVRRRDQPEAAGTDLVPRPDEDVATGAPSPSEDGGVSEHPIHDEDQEDLGPEDFEELTDEAEDADELALNEDEEDEEDTT